MLILVFICVVLCFLFCCLEFFLFVEFWLFVLFFCLFVFVFLLFKFYLFVWVVFNLNWCDVFWLLINLLLVRFLFFIGFVDLLSWIVLLVVEGCGIMIKGVSCEVIFFLSFMIRVCCFNCRVSLIVLVICGWIFDWIVMWLMIILMLWCIWWLSWILLERL